MNQQRQKPRKLTLDSSIKINKLRERDPRENLRQNPDSTSVIETEVSNSGQISADLLGETLNLADLKIGKGWLEIEHRVNPQDRQKPYYSTSITNRSTEKIRIDRFGTYTQAGDVLVLHSITGGFFSSQQFQEWYSFDRSLWLEPGQVVIDPNNHSSLGIYWTYFGSTASGKQFIAGVPWLGVKPWWQLW
jgi:hypothetical protein